MLIAGEVHNSNASSLEYMKDVWEQAEALGLNTLLLPVAWENIEPVENQFDFSLVDGLIMQARRRGKHVVFLWFGAWKNGECMYAPAWVKTDLQRFRRGQIVKGLNKAPRNEMPHISYTTLSYLCDETCRADAKAFARLMAHLKEVDGEEHTVVAMQVENETGLLGAAREMSDEADAQFSAEVPPELSSYLRSHMETMVPDVREAVSAGAEAGSWRRQFGPVAEELFSAYHIASYVQRVASAGKAQYPLPMAVNCWLDKGGKPGTYPSGGPVSRMREVWRYAAPSIDLFCPDIYVPNFCEVCDEYTRRGEPLFIPECATHSYAAPRLAYCIGHYHAICYAPFGFEDMGRPFTAIQSFLFGVDVTDPALKTPQDPEEYHFMAHALNELMPQLTSAYGTDALQAVCSEQKTPAVMEFGIFQVQAMFQSPILPRQDGVCLGLRTSQTGCILLLNGCSVQFQSAVKEKPNLDFLCIEEGFVSHGEWHTLRRLNGDEAMSLCFEKPTLLRVTVHIYE